MAPIVSRNALALSKAWRWLLCFLISLPWELARFTIEDDPLLFRFDFYDDLFSRLIGDAVEQDKISLSRRAEMLGIGVEKM